MKRMLFTMLLVSLCAMSTTAAKKVYRRQIVKEFSVGERPELSLSNSFGEIRIVEGADRKIIVQLELRGEGRTEEEARRYNVYKNRVFALLRRLGYGEAVQYIDKNMLRVLYAARPTLTASWGIR